MKRKRIATLHYPKEEEEEEEEEEEKEEKEKKEKENERKRKRCSQSVFTGKSKRCKHTL